MPLTITAKEIAERLAHEAERFCHWLYPNGKIDSGEFCVGSVGGEAGKSLKVHLSGSRAGVWADFADDVHRGDLLDLLVAAKGYTMSQAIKAAKDYLGIYEIESVIRPKRYTKPDPKQIVAARIAEQGDVWAYLIGCRGLKDETLRAYRMAEYGREMVFPSFNPAGELLNMKYIGIDRDQSGKKFIRQEQGCAPSLWGWQSINSSHRAVVITEGQLDAMSWHQMGFPALSVPDGVANDGWIEFDWENLQQFDTIYLNFDNDEPGKKATIATVERLGKARCMVVILPRCKDANELLTSNGTQHEFAHAITRSKPISPKQIKSPADYRDHIHDIFAFTTPERKGVCPELLSGKIIFRPGEFTVWTGFSSHGKSVILSQVILESIAQGHKAAIASMEMTGAQTLARMICQKLGKEYPTIEEVDKCIDDLVGKLWIYDLIGSVRTTLLFELMEYSFARHNVDDFVIDSLMKTEVRVDDYQSQKDFADQCHTFCVLRQRHIHLVAHARKSQGRYQQSDAPTRDDVKGNSDVTNMADNVIIVFRNKKKESLPAAEKVGKPDTIVIIDKQRNKGFEGRLKLWYEQTIYTFSPKDPADAITQADLPAVQPHWVIPPPPPPDDGPVGGVDEEEP